MLKFRAWHKLEKRMFPVSALYFDMLGVEVVRLLDGADTWSCPAESVELMRHTGYVNFDLVDLYEGDIVTIGEAYDLMYIRFNAGGFEIRDIKTDRVMYFMGLAKVSNVKVLGSIYQNPELLKVEKK